jgi:hypothetical protein
MLSDTAVTIGSTVPEFDFRRWGELVSLLSMDVVSPFYGLMGLRFGAPERLQRLLRHEIVRWRNAVANAPTPVSGPFVGSQRFVASIAESIGAESARHLVWWERYVFHNDPRDNLDLDRWDTVLRCSRLEPALWRRLFPDPFSEEALDRFRRSLNIDEYRRRQEDVDARPLSDWDLHLYAIHLYDDNLYSEADYVHVPDGPRVWVEPTIRDYQGRQFWAWVLKALSPDRLDRLWQNAHAIVKDEELSSVRGLPHPSALDIWQ